MLKPQQVFDWLAKGGVDFYAGVPDSLLKDFCAYVTDHATRHVITANEGSAVSMAMGYHLATGGIGAVYMQNSGLGNTINPLTSLTDPAVYGVPMLLVVGWRGEPGKKDEPQHVHMGQVTPATLDAVAVPYTVLPDDPEEAKLAIAAALRDARDRSAPHALVVRKGTFDKYALADVAPRYPLTREEAIGAVIAKIPTEAAIISTTGKPSRELFELREQRQQAHDSDLLIVGGMGHASQIALGVALAQPERPVFCLDGDGAVIMHMGGMATIATTKPANYKHIVLNNGAHDSVGGQPTVGFDIAICDIARACGYAHVAQATDAESLANVLDAFIAAQGPALLEVRIQKGARSDLGRPTMRPVELKRAFMQFLS